MPFVLACALLVLSSGPELAEEIVVSEAVDLAEVNHFYDENGKLVFDQVIFYDWSDDESRYHVRAWRLLKHASQFPQRNWSLGGYESVWRDGDVLRSVRASAFRETWTQHDPELLERAALPKEQRKELRTVGVQALSRLRH
ncbi:hypothetical protein [Lignipirellula cremea]|uniref:Uncharacterized protein n=1 Tax=Lignipirellula cremea TaxID=2528010 RepID=A0A518DMT5_9BACT|nr:hypothetical protein [Lignipirellula cremea]QDU93133.1 hypothetical protein Pla8534_09120 [Lignipirellula cremea]